MEQNTTSAQSRRMVERVGVTLREAQIVSRPQKAPKLRACTTSKTADTLVTARMNSLMMEQNTTSAQSRRMVERVGVTLREAQIVSRPQKAPKLRACTTSKTA